MGKTILTILIFLLSVTAFSQRGNRSSITREEELNRKYCSGLFCTLEGTYFDLENNPAAIGANTFINVLDWLQGRVAGLQVHRVHNIRIPFIRNQPAVIFVDEIRVDPSFLNVLAVNDIAMIKVMRTPSASFWGAPGGVIAVYTKRGESEE